MGTFRPLEVDSHVASDGDLLAVSQVIDDAMRPECFFAAPELRLLWIAAKAETIPWEIFQGRLVDAAHTRESKSFLSWHVGQDSEPVVSVKLDVRAREIHVVRGILAYVWEGHGDGVIESRESIKWTRELVGTIVMARFTNLDSLRDELICLIWQAVVGTSRLPLHSIEAPLPAFTLGQLHYCYCPEGARQAGTLELQATAWETFLDANLRQTLGWSEKVKLVEFALRHVHDSELPRLAERIRDLPLPRLLRSLFNDVSLSPWTGFAERAFALLDHLRLNGGLTPNEKLEFLERLMQQVCRHLSAYDLITFHHRGANYPDALLLDLALKAYLTEIEIGTSQTGKAGPVLAQACLMRWHYQGHLVPDAPTSPGENARVMPADLPRVPEEQLTQVLRRRKVLYGGDRLSDILGENARRVLEQSLKDPALPSELGMAVFIDRPLGYGKAPVEPDQTPLLAHVAFSVSLAKRRIKEVEGLCAELGIVFAPSLATTPPDGLSHGELADCPRPVAALADVRKVADDFVILRTFPVGLRTLLEQFDLTTFKKMCRLDFLEYGPPRLCVQARDAERGAALTWYDDRLRPRVAMTIDASEGTVTRAAAEVPQPGLRVFRVWEDTNDPDALERRDVDLVLSRNWQD